MGGDFFGAIAFLGALGAARSTRIFWGWWIFCDSFFGALGAARSTRSNSDFEGGDFWAIAFLEVLGVARSARGGWMVDILGIIFDWFCRIFGLGSFVL